MRSLLVKTSSNRLSERQMSDGLAIIYRKGQLALTTEQLMLLPFQWTCGVHTTSKSCALCFSHQSFATQTRGLKTSKRRPTCSMIQSRDCLISLFLLFHLFVDHAPQTPGTILNVVVLSDKPSGSETPMPMQYTMTPIYR